MGSLLPLSSSSIGRSCSFNPCFLLRRMENTDAESVDDITAAISKDSVSVRAEKSGYETG